MKYEAVIKKEMNELIKSGVIKRTDLAVVYEKFNNVYQEGIKLGRRCSCMNHTTAVSQYDEKMRFIKRWETVVECAKELGFTPDNIHKAARAKTLTHKGYFVKMKSKAKKILKKKVNKLIEKPPMAEVYLPINGVPNYN